MTDVYQSHPKWKELEQLCDKITYLKVKAKELREEIDNDIFGKKELK